ncbi:hypothetical protein, partial [Bifidobacterium pseudocatenulatum]|uniref:hypothetical protein n=1 Tax=Bifidobacterium pseudocatenulatum TaxID=28026 RepID=UPI0022E46C73
RRQASRFATKGLAFRSNTAKNSTATHAAAATSNCTRNHTQPHMQPHATACGSRETQATFTRNGKATTTQRQSQRN